MLTLTDNASSIVKTITAQTPGAENGGLRISSADAESTDFAVAVTGEPEPNDQVVESAGARVFLQDHVAQVLDDKVLDAEVEENGSVKFAISLAA